MPKKKKKKNYLWWDDADSNQTSDWEFPIQVRLQYMEICLKKEINIYDGTMPNLIQIVIPHLDILIPKW